MSWYAQTDEAKKQLELCEKNNCGGCSKCIWIEESAHAMQEYGTPVKKAKVDMPRKSEKADYFVRKKLDNNKNKHPLYDLIVEKFCK